MVEYARFPHNVFSFDAILLLVFFDLNCRRLNAGGQLIAGIFYDDTGLPERIYAEHTRRTVDESAYLLHLCCRGFRYLRNIMYCEMTALAQVR